MKNTAYNSRQYNSHFHSGVPSALTNHTYENFQEPCLHFLLMLQNLHVNCLENKFMRGMEGDG